MMCYNLYNINIDIQYINNEIDQFKDRLTIRSVKVVKMVRITAKWILNRTVFLKRKLRKDKSFQFLPFFSSTGFFFFFFFKLNDLVILHGTTNIIRQNDSNDAWKSAGSLYYREVFFPSELLFNYIFFF